LRTLSVRVYTILFFYDFLFFLMFSFFFFSSRRRHTRCYRDWSSDVCSSDLFLAFCAQAQKLVFEDDHRPIVANRGSRQSFGVIGSRRNDHFETGNMSQDGIQCLGMLRPGATAVGAVVATARAVSGANYQREVHLTAHHVM